MGKRLLLPPPGLAHGLAAHRGPEPGPVPPAPERQTTLDEAEWNAIPAAAPDVSHEDRLVLQDALARLGAEEGQIVLLHAVTGLKHREIAQLLELPLSTVLSKYHRGLKKLKALMKGESDR